MKINNNTIRSLTAFTLLELIVALALMDIIAVALYSSIYTAFIAKEKSQMLISPFQSITPAFEFIRNDLVSTMNPHGILAGVFLGENNPGIADLDADTLSFYTSNYQPDIDEVASNIVNVAYALERDLQRNEIVLKRFIIKNILSPTTLEPQEQIICRGIAGLDIKYYDGSSWLDEWDSSVENAQLPWAVKITLTTYNEDQQKEQRRVNRRSSEDLFREFTRIFMLPSANQKLNEENQEQV